MHSLDRPSQPWAIDGIAVLSGWAHSAWRAYARRRRQRWAIAELDALSDRSLADIGIERSEIASIVSANERDASRRAR